MFARRINANKLAKISPSVLLAVAGDNAINFGIVPSLLPTHPLYRSALLYLRHSKYPCDINRLSSARQRSRFGSFRETEPIALYAINRSTLA